jgi:hypothetical protein
METGGRWHLMVVMDARMTIVFDGVGDGQRQGGGELTVQSWRQVATVQ